MGSMCQDSQECFHFGGTFYTGTRVFPQKSYPKLQFLTRELLGIMLETGYKTRRLYFITWSWRPSLLNFFFFLEEHMSVTYPVSLSLKVSHPHPYSVTLKLRFWKLYFLDSLPAHFPFKPCNRGNSWETRSWQDEEDSLPVSDPIKCFQRKRKLWFHYLASFGTPSTCRRIPH